MSAAAAARRIADRFDEEEIAYAIGGALALGVWGAPRNTIDVDISVFVDLAELPRVIDALERAGALVDRKGAAREAARIGLFRARLGRTPVDVFVSGHPHAVKTYVREWIEKMVPAGDRRLDVLRDLTARFVEQA